MRTTHGASRRRFLKQVAAAALAGPSLRAGALLGAPAGTAVNETIGIGLIGCGSLGVNYHLGAYLPMKDVRMVAVCDVDQGRREQAAGIVEKHYGGKHRPGIHNDYRELLDRNDVDAVIVVTPDHWHALQTIHACQAGKDVHCEKPLSLTVEEGRAMVTAARRYGRVVQTGSESRSKEGVRRACELVRSGRIGKLEVVETGLGQNPFCSWSPPGTLPAGLDWDLWLGPAPAVPYHKHRCHYTFRWFRDYSGGKITDWGAHMNDVAQWGLGTDATGPVHVEATSKYRPGNMYEFAPEFQVTCTYASGVKLVYSSDDPHVTFRGSRGVVRTGLGGVTSDPVEISRESLGPDDVHLYESDNHDRDWLECIRSRQRPVADVEIGHRSCTVCHLGNIAVWTGRPIRWDPGKETIIDDEEASRFLSKPMRSPWHL